MQVQIAARRRPFLVVPSLALAGLMVCAAAPAAPLSDRDETAGRHALRSAPGEGFGDSEFPAQVASEALREEPLAYAKAQHGGRIPLARLPWEWAIRPAPYDDGQDFSQAQASNRGKAWLAGLAPPDPAYRTLTSAYVRYRDLAAHGGWPSLTRTARVGDVGDAVTALRARLAVEDASAPTQGDTYDPALQAAVVRAQQRHGLESDDETGQTTLAALNVTARARADQIAANLERWRWMTRARAVPSVDNNLADASQVYVCL